MDEMRKAFEAHCARNWIDTERVMDGPYKDASTQRAWEAWQAATMAERERVTAICKALAGDEEFGRMDADGALAVADAIRGN